MRRSRFFPKPKHDRAWLYLLERSDGVIKVGQTGRPHVRFFNHVAQCETHSVALQRFHLLSPMSRLATMARERSAICLLEGAAQRIGKTEEFRGISFAAALAIVRTAEGA